MSANEQWVTEHFSQWLTDNHKSVVDEKVAHAAEQNAKALASGSDPEGDTEYVADELQEFAEKTLHLPEWLEVNDASMINDLIDHAIAEADWYEIAEEFLSQQEEEK